ncbi:hypothetical protein ACROYT_G022369 [Oculina patagonica]
MMAFENELGVQAPVGFWDPAGLSSDGSVEDFKRRRQTELKHGRISMLATMGYITPEITGKFPGYLSPSAGLKFADVPNGLAAISKVPAAGWGQILAYMAFCEVSQDQSAGTPAAAGDFGWKLITSTDPEVKKTKLNAELANGRLAMMAIIGMFFQDGLTGSAWGDWANYTASPLRAFENELGVQAPVGFWDPAGLSADGGVAAFKRRRSAELKHGRISMMATMGDISLQKSLASCAGLSNLSNFRFCAADTLQVPRHDLFKVVAGRLCVCKAFQLRPGYLSPSAGLKFADIPNGLAAVSKVPVAGWAQIAAYFGFVEFSSGFDDYKTGTPGDYGFKLLTSSDPGGEDEETFSRAGEWPIGYDGHHRNVLSGPGRLQLIGMFFQVMKSAG